MKIAIIGYGEMGKEIERQAKKLSCEVTKIIDLDTHQQVSNVEFDEDEIAIEFSTPCLLTVLAKYLSVQNSPPHNSFFTSGHSLKTPLAVMLFTVVTIFVNEYVETDCTKK